MKRLFALLFFIFASFYCIAQQPLKKASKIIVLTSDTANTFLNRIAKVLFDKGFSIESKDDAVKVLATKAHAIDHPSLFIKVRASVNDTAVVFTGEYSWAVTARLFPETNEYTQIDYRGLKNSAAMQAWNSLDKIARSFGDKIIYQK